MSNVASPETAKNRVLFMLWMKNEQPALYAAAMKKVMQSNGGYLSGLGDDDDDDDYVGGDDPLDFSGDTDQPADTSTDTSSSSPSLSQVTSAISSLIGTSASLINAVDGTTATQSAALVQTNIARLNANLPPLNANGTVMTAAQMAAAGYSQTQINAVEANMVTSAGGLSTTMLLVIAAGVALLAIAA